MNAEIISCAAMARLGFSRLAEDDGVFWVATPACPEPVQSVLARCGKDLAIPASRDGTVGLGGYVGDVLARVALDQVCTVDIEPGITMSVSVDDDGMPISVFAEARHGEVAEIGAVYDFDTAKEIAQYGIVAGYVRAWITGPSDL